MQIQIQHNTQNCTTRASPNNPKDGDLRVGGPLHTKQFSTRELRGTDEASHTQGLEVTVVRPIAEKGPEPEPPYADVAFSRARTRASSAAKRADPAAALSNERRNTGRARSATPAADEVRTGSGLPMGAPVTG